MRDSGVLRSAVSLLTAAAGRLLPRRHNPRGPVYCPGKATWRGQLLGELFAGSAPGKLVSAEVGGDPAAPAVRCRFARGSDVDACASWVGTQVRAWLEQRTGRTCNVEVSRETFAPVVETRCRAE